MKIALLGDIAFFGKFSLKQNEELFKYFENVSKILNKFDYVVGNLETPFVNGHKPYGYKSAYISSVIENVKILKYLGVNVVNLANNHIYDYGPDALQLTKEILEKNDIQYFGIENKSVLLQKNDNFIKLNGYCCYSTNPQGLNDAKINKLNYQAVADQLRVNYDNGYNSIISLHAGQEHVNYPNYDHIRFARAISNFAPYVYYGHHPHVLQGIEQRSNSLIAYSLGNFCFDDVFTSKSTKPLIEQNSNNKSSIILELRYKNNKLQGFDYHPIYMGGHKMETDHPEIIDNLIEYSKKLEFQSVEYKTMRNELFTQYIQSRKKRRNFIWYLKRLNINSLLMIYQSRLNRKKYNQNLIKYLS